MSDYIVRMIAKEVGVRGFACLTTDIVQEAARRHQTSPVATIALGQALNAAALMGGLLKTRQRIALKFEGDGPLAKIIPDAATKRHGDRAKKCQIMPVGSISLKQKAAGLSGGL